MGAVDGSQWACRETFVAVIVTNLPIIQPLLRKGASKVGLSALFSKPRSSKGESHQLESHEGTGSRFGVGSKKRRPPGPLSIPQTGAWGSDEEILPQGDGRGDGWKDDRKGIVVTQEIGVHSERGSENNVPEAAAWGYSTSR